MHLCQRVMAAARPAEIVVSSTVKDLVAGPGIESDDRGEHDLKGVPGKWRVFAVTN
jgi:class 3 adenylate cyclase